MSINLGLQRVTQLLSKLNNPEAKFKVIHVGGTNGKGSVCTYIEHILSCAGYSTGKFTSPHLITPADMININEHQINNWDEKYRDISRFSVANGIHATPFELSTALAFNEFAANRVDFGVVEVGLGGLLDATNVVDPVCSVLTKIGVDHESLLGSSLVGIARHKAGIIKPGKPCVIDSSNAMEVIEVVRGVASKLNSPLTLSPRAQTATLQNQSVAESVANILGIPESKIKLGISSAKWLGRMQYVNSRTLVDGAHNVEGAKQLRRYIDTLNKPVDWVMAFSKPCGPILNELLRPTDSVYCVEFEPVENMPWIKSLPVMEIANEAIKHTHKVTCGWPTTDSGQTTVVCGSLYLVGQFLSNRFNGFGYLAPK